MGFLPRAPLFRDDTKGDALSAQAPASLILPQAAGIARSDCASFFLGKRSAGMPRSGPFGADYLRRTPGESPNETCPPLAGRQPEYRRQTICRLDDQNLIQWQRSFPIDKDRLEKGIQNLGFGGFSVHFWASKSEPRGVGAGSPHMLPYRMEAIRETR